MARIKFTHEQAEAASVRASYAPGWVYAVPTSAEILKSKEKEGMEGVQYDMIMVNWKPLRDQSDIQSGVGRGISDYWCLPFVDDSWDDLGSPWTNPKTGEEEGTIGERAKKNCNTIFAQQTHKRMRALFPNEVPDVPHKNENGELVYNGEVINSSSYKTNSGEAIYTAYNKVDDLFSNGVEPLMELGCYVLVAYEKGSDYPSIKAYSAEPPIDFKTREPLPVLSGAAIMGGRDTSSEETVEETTISKKNGAAAKPSATRATVAAATKVKGKASGGKAARR